jgi:hypothetical protein
MAAADRLIVPQSLDAIARLVPAETASDGFALETYVLARLMGLKLLTLEGVVLVSPAAVHRGDAESTTIRHGPARRDASSGRGSRRTGKVAGVGHGSALAAAARLVDECTAELEALTATRV